MMLLRPPLEVWHAGDPAALAVFAGLQEALPEADLRPRGGHPKEVLAVVLLCSPALRRTELGQGDPELAAALTLLFSADEARRDDPVVPVLVDGRWEEVAPEDLQDARPFRLTGDGAAAELLALLQTLRALLGTASDA